MSFRAEKRVYANRHAVGVLLSDGNWYTDAVLLDRLNNGETIIGLTCKRGKLSGTNVIPLSKLRRVNLNSRNELESAIRVSSDTVYLEREMTLGGSCGDVRKWLLKDSHGYLYAKGRSNRVTFEPEAEVCAYRLAVLFGIPAIKYRLVKLDFLDTRPVCVSRDFSQGYTTLSLLRYLELLGKWVAKAVGVDKYKLVTSVLSPRDVELHNNILYFDYLIGNRDRHLRNFEVRLTNDGSLVNLVEVFDNGACLFSNISSTFEIERWVKAGNNFVHSKPYCNPHKQQLSMLRELGIVSSMRKVNRSDIYKVINSSFSFTGDNRAKLLGQYVVQNAERLGLLWG